jgi:hypothetical protein
MTYCDTPTSKLSTFFFRIVEFYQEQKIHMHFCFVFVIGIKYGTGMLIVIVYRSLISIVVSEREWGIRKRCITWFFPVREPGSLIFSVPWIGKYLHVIIVQGLFRFMKRIFLVRVIPVHAVIYLYFNCSLFMNRNINFITLYRDLVSPIYTTVNYIKRWFDIVYYSATIFFRFMNCKKPQISCFWFIYVFNCSWIGINFFEYTWTGIF